MRDYYGIFEDFIMEDFSEPDDSDKYWREGIYVDETLNDASNDFIDDDDD